MISTLITYYLHKIIVIMIVIMTTPLTVAIAAIIEISATDNPII